MSRQLQRPAGLFVLLCVLLSGIWVFHHPILPTPGELWHGLLRLSYESAGYPLALTTMRSFMAFLLALAGGILWAALLRPATWRGELLYPLLILLQAAPVLLWIVPLVLLLGTGHAAPVIAAFLVVLPLVALEFRGVFSAASAERRDFWRHYVPEFFPRLVLRLYYDWRPHLSAATGMGLLLSFKASVIAEWFAARDGIGRRWQQAFVRVDMTEFILLAALFLATALTANALGQTLIRQAGWLRRLYRPNLRPVSGSTLRLNHVTFAYRRQKILQEVTLELLPGELCILTGDSGCGKSTLAKLAAGLLKPQAGEVAASSGSVCLMFQADFLLEHESVLENTVFYQPQKKINAVRILRETGLEPDMPAKELSGGMRRRLALARALVSPAPVLILDEPFHGLHDGAIRQIASLLRQEQQKGRSILLISHHILPEIQKQADKIYHLSQGRLDTGIAAA